MRKFSTASLARLAMLVTMVALMPWWARSRSEFGSRALIAILLALTFFAVIRYGLPIILHKRLEERSTLPNSGLKNEDERFRPLYLLRLVTMGALFIGLAGIVLEHMYGIKPIVAFCISIIGQQLVFIGLEVFLISRVIGHAKTSLAVFMLVSCMALAVLFAWSNNMFAGGQAMGALPPLLSKSMILFSTPVLITGALGIFRATRSASP